MADADNPFFRPRPAEPTRSVEEYVAWFNQSFTFARARVVVGQDGKKSVDLQPNGRSA